MTSQASSFRGGESGQGFSALRSDSARALSALARSIETMRPGASDSEAEGKHTAGPRGNGSRTWKALPSALSFELARRQRMIVFLDYDGTLTPIVSDPAAATLSETMREAVRRLAENNTVAVVSGRAREKVRDFVKLSELYYAGSHGFDIDGPCGMRHAVSSEIVPLLGAAREKLELRLAGIEGAAIEDNRFSISVHWRNVLSGEARARVEAIVDEVLATPPLSGALRKSTGKCVYELRPNVRWNKGEAVLYLLELLRHSQGAAERRKITAPKAPDDFDEDDDAPPDIDDDDANNGTAAQDSDDDDDDNATLELERADCSNSEQAVAAREARKQRIFSKAWYRDVLPVYIGDDTTDEDAFGALKPLGGLCVLNVAQTCEKERPLQTQATHVLRGVHDVETFINRLATLGAAG